MPTLQLIWYLLTYVTYTTNSQLNEYTKQNGSNGEDMWLSTSDFIPQQSKSYGTIRLGQIMSMEFDFTFWGRNAPGSDKFEMFFRIGYDATLSKACAGEGARYPSFWLTNNRPTMHVSVSSGTSCQPKQSLNEYGNITIGETYHIKIEFNNTRLSVTVTGGGKPYWNQQWLREPIPKTDLGNTVPVWWMSNKYSGTFQLGNGTFRNVIIKSNIFTMEPTVAPTYFTTMPTITPTSNPTNNPTVTENPTINPTIPQPTISPSTVQPTMPTMPTIQTYTPTVNPTANPTVSPTMTPTMTSVIVSTTQDGVIVTDTQDGSEFGDDFKSGVLDAYGTIGIIIAAIAVFCCLFCGMIILWKNQKRNKNKSNETKNGSHIRIQSRSYKQKQLETEMNNMPQNDNDNDIEKQSQHAMQVGVAYSRGEVDYNDLNEDIFTPDGVIKKHQSYLSAAQQHELYSTPKGPNHHEQYLSSAQKHELNSTPKGPNHHDKYLSSAQKKELYATPVGPNKQNSYDGYLSAAQKEIIKRQITPGGSDSESDDDDEHNALVSDDCQTSDDEIIADMQTAGYIEVDNVNSNGNIAQNENSDSLSEMSGEVPIEKKLTIGAYENSNENAYDNEYEYNDDSLSELDECNGITMQ